jgi:DNA-binding transcriptional ArsR family regulator
MSQSPLASAIGHYVDSSSEVLRRIEGEDRIQELLDVLNDPGSRDILDATSDTALSANEVSETCDLPLSTTYRKLELLTSVGLLEERTRVRRSGKHPNEYVRAVTRVVISLDSGEGTELQVSHRGHTETVESVSCPTD